jgi:hypothetical protein
VRFHAIRGWVCGLDFSILLVGEPNIVLKRLNLVLGNLFYQICPPSPPRQRLVHCGAQGLVCVGP